MQLARILFAGALLFGAGCEPYEEGELATDQRSDPADLDRSIDHDDHIDQVDHESEWVAHEMEGRAVPDQACTVDLSRLSDIESAELQGILNTAIVDNELALARLAPEQVARIQDILASAIVM